MQSKEKEKIIVVANSPGKGTIEIVSKNDVFAPAAIIPVTVVREVEMYQQEKKLNLSGLVVINSIGLIAVVAIWKIKKS